MTPGRRRARLLLVLTVPVLLLVAGAVVARFAARDTGTTAEKRLRARAERLRRDFAGLLDEAARAARFALEEPWNADALGERIETGGALGRRLEGAGVLGPDNGFRRWIGTPAEPGPRPSGAAPEWSVRVEGLWTRLVVRTAPDSSGRSGLATFILDGPFPDQRFVDLLPRGLGDLPVDVDFVEDAHAADDLGVLRRRDPPALFFALTSKTGRVLALATLQETSPAQRAASFMGLAQTLAAIAMTLLLAALFDWRALCRTGLGALLAIASVAASRAALLASRAPARLLPRELGSPTLYGSPEGWGLLRSPSELLLTCLATFLVWRALRALIGTRRPGSPILAAFLAGSAAFAFTSLLIVLTFLLARDARISLIQLGQLVASPGTAFLLAGLSLGLVTAAEAWALVLSALRERWRSMPLRAATLALVPIAALATVTLLHTRDKLGLDRLRSEFAPEVLEQESRRRVALVATAREAAAADAAADAVLAPPQPGDTYVAYLLWASGDLFHAGYQSALDVYDAQGERRSHFGFNLPALSEEVEPPPPGAEPVVKPEDFHEVVAHTVKLLHAAAPIVHEGSTIGTVVVHVLDEPENLPFLPSSLPYLAALGFGAPHRGGEQAWEAPAYVLYDADGSVVLATVAQPPAPGPALRDAAAAGATVEVVAGREAYVALPLPDRGRLHVLLLPARTWLDRLGAFLRLFLLGTGALLLLAVVQLAMHPRELLRVPQALRGSFYRKLLAVLLLASAVPLLGLSLFVRSYVAHRAQGALVESASRLVQVVESVIEDYAATEVAEEPMSAMPEMNDEILDWLRRVVRQEIHLYENSLVTATSKRELFASGLIPVRLPGEVEERLVAGRLPYVVFGMRLGGTTIPVAYARLRLPGASVREAIAAVPLVLQQRDFARAINRISEMLLLSTALLAVFLAGGAAVLARTVARPVRDLVDATRRIAAGDTGTRLRATTRDELAELVLGFNAMAAALAAQRADLERRRDYIETLLRNATTGVLSTDPEGRIVTLNPAAEALLSGPGGPPRVGEPLAAAVARNAELVPLAAALARERTPDGEPQEIDLDPQGRLRRMRLVRVPLPDPDGGVAGALLLLDDVTDLMRSNQLAAWAEMARAIAHEIKNPLTPIQLSTEHLERLLADRSLLPWPEVEACVETVIKQVRTLREIAAEFSTYARLPDMAPVPTDPAELLGEVLSPYRAALPPGITIEERYEPCPAIGADRRVLGRAIVNLVENALYAMAGGGVLRLGAYRDDARGEVVLEVADTGPGLAPEVRARLFEPYFSTKSAGTGLGLAIARRAVEGHRGTIDVESSPGAGTVFRIRIPALH